MFLKSIYIKNFRLFPSDEFFEITDLNIPNGEHEGSGLTVFVGENACGKTSLIDAFSLPYVSYKADNFSLSDINNPEEKVEINILTDTTYSYKGTMPKIDYKGKGFSFQGGIRARGNRGFLSSIVVTDQKYIRADGETKPLDNSPDLRLTVNNPWSGPRFSEIEYLILDKNRIFQTRKGTYSDTRFDKLMEDLNFQYIRKKNPPVDYNEHIIKLGDVENEGINETIRKFSEVTGKPIQLNLIDNWRPFINAYFGVKKDNLQAIPLNQLGSGYEMIFSLIYSYFLSQKGNKKLIILIDEPELHLHPKLQSDFISFLLDLSKDSQVILTTHSPLFVKQAMTNKKVLIKILKKTVASVNVINPESAVLGYLSSNEMNYIAFGLATEEYHNELYEKLKLNKGEGKKMKSFDEVFFQKEKGEGKNYPWKSQPNQVSIHTFVRNQIHHQAENGKADYEDLLYSIDKMRIYLSELK